jgi:hypothetical protein
MADYYNDLVTEKSWQTLQNLKKQIDFILIGGWAVYLYSQALKSKDIDIIISYENLGELRNLYPITKNERLLKYEARNEEVQIDIYLPFYSNLGIPVEEIVKEKKKMAAFTAVAPEMLLILKQYTYKQRHLSAKGQKDRLDIFCLLSKVAFDWNHYHFLVNQHQLSGFSADLKQLIQSTVKIPELDLNEHAFSRLKKKIIPQIPL